MQSAHTAIHRRQLSAPAKWLVSQGLIRPPTLDFGCGHGDLGKFTDLDVESWDPAWHPGEGLEPFRGRFQTVTCLYVLCVLPPQERREALLEAQSCVRPGGRLYVAVRRDLKSEGPTTKGYQANVSLSFPVIHTRPGKFDVYLWRNEENRRHV